jgi:hypothetical protein
MRSKGLEYVEGSSALELGGRKVQREGVAMEDQQRWWLAQGGVVRWCGSIACRLRWTW